MGTSLAHSASADTIRIATYDPALSRDGPGLLLRDLQPPVEQQAAAAVEVMLAAEADILLLTGIDYDGGGAALTALAGLLRQRGLDYPHRFARRPNTGLQSGLDLDGDGRLGGPRDAQGYGRFSGQNGMALLSRYPIDADALADFTPLLWRDLPGAALPEIDGAPFPSDAALSAQRLSSTAHWIVPVQLPGTKILSVLAFAATPPVFDGPEDRNGLRNADEIGLWTQVLDGHLAVEPPKARFVILGQPMLDPVDGEGRHAAIRGLLADPRLQDPMPQSAGASAQANAQHAGNPALDTADWRDDGPGNLRVDYVLPSVDWTVAGAGVLWPEAGSGDPRLADIEAASPHRLVWVDLVLD